MNLDLEQLEKLDELPKVERIITLSQKRKVLKKSKAKVNKSVSELEAAVWQYIVDHSTPYKLGYAVSFVAVSKDDLFRRVEARRNGTFKREDIARFDHRVQMVKNTEKWRQSRIDLFIKAQTVGPWWLRLAVRLRKKLTRFIENNTRRLNK